MMEKYKEMIVGRWYFFSSKPEVVKTSEDEVTEDILDELTDSADDEFEIFLEFKEDGTGVSGFGENEEFDTNDFAYTLDGDNLIITEEFGAMNLKIISFTENELTVMDDETNEYKEEFPDTNIIEVTSLQTYKKA